MTVTAITHDLGSPSVGIELSAAVAAAGLHVTGIINNASFGTFGDFVEENPDRLAQEIAVDISAQVQISAAFVPGMVRAGSGFLINVASMAAYTPTPRMAVYGAAKAFVLSFTESLWAETRPRASPCLPCRPARPARSSTPSSAATTPQQEPGCARPTTSPPPP